ncbi:MAG: ABC transporter ATP-binding protein [Ancrocorticia sp.]|uniref:ABC transporter ATP-binding protein n=1 Tax=Ancrocorticia sp. TaxID=2593684 RepID=UPI003F93DE16
MSISPYGLTVRDLSLTLGTFTLHDVSFRVAPGEVLVIVGPSGCGKSTLLHALSGLIQSRGTVSIDSVDVSGIPPEERETGLVFQSPVLFPGLSVRENIGYGLDDARTPEGKRNDLIDIAMANLNINGLGATRPASLSGGQSQRVALAQTLVRRPRVLLLDEPLSHVEAPLRRDIRRDVKAQVVRGRLAAVYVTHDLEDAFLMADRVAVMRQGEIVQLDTPMNVYRRPSSRFVADLLGLENILSVIVLGRPDSHHARVQLGRLEYEIPCHPGLRIGPAMLVLPPESITLRKAPHAADVVGDTGQVIGSAFAGSRSQTEVETEVGTLVVHEWDASAPRSVGDSVRFAVRAERGWVLER